MKRDKEWLKEAVGELPCVDTVFNSCGSSYIDSAVPVMAVYDLIDQLGEPEVLSKEWIDKHKVARINNLRKMTMSDVVPVEDLQNLLVPKQEEVDRAYKDGYEKGKQHTSYKGYLKGLADKEKEPETVASVIADFYKSFERFKEVISMEVEEVAE